MTPPRAPRRADSSRNPDKVKLVQQQVDEVVSVMHQNMEKVIERGERLDQLQEKTGTREQRRC